MRIIAFKTLKDYYQNQPNAKTALENWYHTTKNADWNGLSDIKKDFNSVDFVGNKRYVFNIKGNDFRLIAKILFVPKLIYIRFVGTHAEYDKIKDIKNI